MISGKGGAVNSDNCVRAWGAWRRSQPAEGVCSASDGAVFRGPGILDWQGFYTGYGHTPSILPGTKFQFKGATRDSYGVQSVANGAIMRRTTIKWNVEQGKFIEYINEFEACTGALSLGAVSATDTSTPNPLPSRDCVINLTGCTELREMELVLECKNPYAVTSSTGGRRERDEGNKDASFKCKVYTDDANFSVEDAIAEIQFGVDGATNLLKWVMKWAILTMTAPLLRIEGAGVTPGFFEANLAGKFTAYYSGGKGNITSPVGAAWWP